MKKINKGFTIVELIIVVLILFILGAIGYISTSGFLAGARDSSRMAQLKLIENSLRLYSEKERLPEPEKLVEINSLSGVIAYQGYVGKEIIDKIEYTGKGLDPKDKKYFSYYIPENRKCFQLLTTLEKANKYVDDNESKERYPYVIGKQLGILTDSNNTPIQEILTGSLNISDIGNEQYKSFLTGKEYINGTGTSFSSLGLLADECGYKSIVNKVNNDKKSTLWIKITTNLGTKISSVNNSPSTKSGYWTFSPTGGRYWVTSTSTSTNTTYSLPNTTDTTYSSTNTTVIGGTSGGNWVQSTGGSWTYVETSNSDNSNPIVIENVGLNVILHGDVGGGDGNYTYDWDFGDGNTGNGKDVTHLYNSAGTYTIKLVVIDGDGATASAQVIVVLENGCSKAPSYPNANFIDGTPTLVGESWQNINSADACYYSCKNGYTGNDCNTVLGYCTTKPNYTNTYFYEGIPVIENQPWQNQDSNSGCYYNCVNGYTGNDCSINPGSCKALPNYYNAAFSEGYPSILQTPWQNTNSADACYYTCVNGYSGNDCSIAPPSCETQPNYSNTNFVVGTPLTSGVTWQNTNSADACYYECTNGYTGNDCSIAPPSCEAQPNYSNTNFVAGTPLIDGTPWQNTNSADPCYYSCANLYSGFDCSISDNISLQNTNDILGDNSSIYYFPMISSDPYNEVISNNNGTGSNNLSLTPGIFNYNGNSINSVKINDSYFNTNVISKDLGGNYSYSFLVKVNSFINGTVPMAQGQHTNGTVLFGSTNIIGLYYYNNELYYSQYNYPGFSTVSLLSGEDFNLLNNGEIHNITFTRNSGNVSLYLDGVLKSTKSVSTAVQNYYNNRYLLNQNSGDIEYSEIRFFNRELNQTDVNKILTFYNYVSCKDILDKGRSIGNGIYTINPTFNKEIQVYCDMTTDGGGWTRIIKDNTTTLADLELFGDTSEIASTFYTDPIKGIGWSDNIGDGINKWNRKNLNINFSYSDVKIKFSGEYNVPSGGLGGMSLSSDGINLLSFVDSWSTPSSGQSLHLYLNSIYFKSRNIELNRFEIINYINSNTLNISMSGLDSNYYGYPYGYTKRYIGELWLR